MSAAPDRAELLRQLFDLAKAVVGIDDDPIEHLAAKETVNIESDGRTLSCRHEMSVAADALTAADLSRYLDAKNSAASCPMCRWNRWQLGEPRTLGIARVALAFHQNVRPTSFLPVLVLTCGHCGFLRMHAAIGIAHWKAEARS